MGLLRKLTRPFRGEAIIQIPPPREKLHQEDIKAPTAAMELGIFEGKNVSIKRGDELIQGQLARVFGDANKPTLKVIDPKGAVVLVSYGSIDEIREVTD